MRNVLQKMRIWLVLEHLRGLARHNCGESGVGAWYIIRYVIHKANFDHRRRRACVRELSDLQQTDARKSEICDVRP